MNAWLECHECGALLGDHEQYREHLQSAHGYSADYAWRAADLRAGIDPESGEPISERSQLCRMGARA